MIGGSSGVAEDVVQRWILDPESYEKGIADVAKLVRTQQAEERNLMTVREALDKQTSALTTTTGKLDSGMSSLNASLSKVGMGTSMLAGGVGGLVAMVGTKLVGAIGEGISKFGKFITAGDDFNDTVGENRESVFRMTEATQHMGSAFDVARFRSRLMSSEGLKPTEEQLDSLTKAATSLAAKQKTDWTEAADKLANTWQGMGTRGLRPLNIEIGQNLSLMEKQQQILAGVATMGEAHLSQAQIEKNLIKEKDDAYLHLSSTMNDNDTISAVMDFNQITRVKNEIAWVKSLEQGWNKVWFAIQGPGNTKGENKRQNYANELEAQRSYEQAGSDGGYMAGNYATENFGFGSASEGTGGGVFGAKSWSKETSSNMYSTGAPSPTIKKPSSRGGSRDKSSPFGIREWVFDSLADIDKRALEMVRETAERIKKEMQKGREEDVEAGGEHDKLKAAADFKKFAEQAGRDKTGGKLGGTFGGKLFGDEVLQGAVQTTKALATYQKQVEDLNDTMQNFTLGSLSSMAGGIWAIADAAIQSGEGFGTAMLQMVKSTLLSIAQQATVKAIFSTAEGFALQAATMGIPNPGSVAAFTAAGLYASVAAGAGIVGLGMSAAMAPSHANGGAGAGAGASRGSNSYKPSHGSASKNDQKPIIVNLWLGGKGDPAAALYMRQQVQGMVS